jgi:hypothetical protein
VGLLCVLIEVSGIWSASHLRRAQADDRALYVSHHGTEFTIPLTQVREVIDGRFFLFRLSPPTVTIHLRSPSPPGCRIVFYTTVAPLLVGAAFSSAGFEKPQ